MIDFDDIRASESLSGLALTFVSKFSNTTEFDQLKDEIDHSSIEYVFVEFLLISELISECDISRRPSVINKNSFNLLFPKNIMSSTFYKIAKWKDLKKQESLESLYNEFFDASFSQCIITNRTKVNQNIIIIAFFSAEGDFEKRSRLNYAWNFFLRKLKKRYV